MSEPTANVIEELRAYLAEEGTDLTVQQLLALRQFVDKFDSLEEAAMALDVLDKMGEAA
jgi:hypothetical protein